MFGQTQRKVLMQVVPAMIVTLLSMYVAIYKKRVIFPSFAPDLAEDAPAGERLAFAFRCLIFSILPLLASIMGVGHLRFVNSDSLAADPTAPVPASMKMFIVLQRVLQNNLEQTFIHVFVVLALASTLEVDRLALVPFLVLLFVTGRIAFFLGYLYKPIYRGLGFALTFLPSLAALSYALCLIVY